MDKKKVKEQIFERLRNIRTLYSCGIFQYEKYYKDQVKFLIGLLQEVNKSDWISVKDRLPNLEDSVLVRNENEPEDMWFAHRTDRNDVVVDKNGFAVGYNSEITHWQKIEM